MKSFAATVLFIYLFFYIVYLTTIWKRDLMVKNYNACANYMFIALYIKA